MCANRKMHNRENGKRGSCASSLDGFVNPCRGIGGGHRKLLDGTGGKLATVATSPADSEESSLGVPEVAPPSSQHRNSITPPSVHAFVLRIPSPRAYVSLFLSRFSSHNHRATEWLAFSCDTKNATHSQCVPCRTRNAQKYSTRETNRNYRLS